MNNEDRLDQALEALNGEAASAQDFEAARARVWEKLMASTGANCQAFRGELAAYAEGRLDANRRMLLEDHLARCPECRKAFAELRGERKVVAMPERRSGVIQRYRGWAIAAGIALVALYAGRGRIDDAFAPSGPRATVEMVAGELHRLPEGMIKVGQPLNEGEVVRTSPGSRAILRLADGSAVEVNERSELYVHAAWSGQTIHLNRGDVIVQAAKQKRGHLVVETRDASATVKGTVFSVSTGLAGSVVSVLEGSVEVSRPAGTALLTRGQSAASTPALDGVSAKQSVAWSKDSDKYFTLLGDMAAIEKQLAAIPGAPLRTAAALLASLPPDVSVYAAAPNLSDTIRQASRLAEQRASESASFKEWWTSESARQLRAAVEQIQSVTPLLGDEMVFVHCGAGNNRVPVLLATVKPGSQADLKQALTRLLPGQELPGFYRVTESLLTFSDSAAHLEWALANAGKGSSSPFAVEIAKHYQRGAGWLIALDVQTAALAAARPDPANARYVFFEQRQTQGGEENEATLLFNGARTGFASWLASAGASGASQYISSDASVVFAATVREPRQIFDELLAQISKMKPGAAEEIHQAESKLGVDFGNEIASALGTDFALAIERPTIPIPGWVAAVEVYKPSTLDGALRKLVDTYNSTIPAGQDVKKLAFTQETVNGRSWSTISLSVLNLNFTWTHHSGYMVAGADRGLVERAIATREGGFPLVRTATFTQQLPSATGVHPSGFLWVNMKGALSDLLNMLPYPALKQLADRRDPVLIAFNGETERIQAASRTRLTSLVLDAMLAGASAGSPGKAQLKKTLKAQHASASH
ncbi:MAG: FecR domain-containing protein [Acidobacteria bacterium]|nr:FecR domain-containing protein [Acidobacteriota bacterium]